MGATAFSCAGHSNYCLQQAETPRCKSDKFLPPKEIKTVSGNRSSVATIVWGVEKNLASNAFTKPAVEPGIRRSVVPFCILFDNRGKLYRELAHGDVEDGIRFISDEYESQASIEFEALNYLRDVKSIMFGLKNRASGSTSRVSFATNFSWMSGEEILIYHPSFLGSQVLILASLTSEIHNMVWKDRKWSLENVSEVIPHGVNLNNWLPWVHRRKKSSTVADAVFLDSQVLRFIRNSVTRKDVTPPSVHDEDDVDEEDSPSRSSWWSRLEDVNIPPNNEASPFGNFGRSSVNTLERASMQDVAAYLREQRSPLGGDDIPSAPNVFPREGGWSLPRLPKDYSYTFGGADRRDSGWLLDAGGGAPIFRPYAPAIRGKAVY